MQGLRKGDVSRVTGLTPHVSAWEGKGTALDMDRRGYGGGRAKATDISDRVPQGGFKGVSSGRLSGEGRDTDGDAGSLLEEAREGHRHHLGGGKPPSSKMHKL